MKFNAWTLLLLLIILYFVFQIREDMLRYYGLLADNKNLNASILELKTSNEDLKHTILALGNNDQIEALARERLNFIKKGETAYKVCRSRSDRK